MYDPEGSDTKREWVEIYNDSETAIDLSGWKFYESSVNHGLTFLDGSSILKSKGYAVIVDEKKSFMLDYPEFKGMLIDSSFSLSNSGEQLVLKNEKGEVEFSLSYKPEGSSGNGYSIEYDVEEWRASYVKYGTPGAKASVKEIKEYEKEIMISELFPYPFKSEYEEYIELFNGSDKDIDLKGWILHDASKSGKYVFPDSLFVKAKEYLAIFKKDFKFALNNSGNESVYLIDPNGQTISSSSYDGSKKNVSYNFNGLIWKWSKFLTPGKENIFNNEPYGKIKMPENIYENVYADFSISARDNDGEKVKVTWDFGDGHKSYLAKTRYKYNKSGKYELSVKLSDGSEDIIKNFKVKVEEMPHPKVRILFVNPNPDGSDTKNETITVENKSRKKINLNGWSIATGWKKFINHPIRGDIEIGKNKSKEITREISSFTLNNKKDKIELRYPDGEVACKLKYKKEEGIEEGEVYKKIEGGWEWEQKITNDKLKISNVSDLSLVTVQSDTKENELSVIGHQSSDQAVKEIEKYENKLITLSNENIKIELLKLDPNFSNDVEIREVDGKYILTAEGKPEQHYVVVFLNELSSDANVKINELLSYFQE